MTGSRRLGWLAVLVMVCGLVAVVGVSFAGVATAEEGPPDCTAVGFEEVNGVYQVENLSQLQCIGDENSETSLNDDFELVENIDATPTADWDGGFEPLGACNGEYAADPWNPCNTADGTTDWDPFTGTFDGNGKMIEGLSIDRPDKNEAALFESTQDAVFSDIRLEDVDIVGNRNAAGLVGYFEGSDVTDTSAGIIENVSVTGDIDGDINTAGIAATPRSGHLDNKNVFIGTVTGSDQVGGIVGRAVDDTRVSTSYVRGTIEAHGEGTVFEGDRGENGVSAGGIVGNSGLASTFTNLYTAVSVTAEDHAGAIVGGHNNPSSAADTFENAYWNEEMGTASASGFETVDGDTPLSTSEMQGDAAAHNMHLDFDGTWQTVSIPDDDYPAFQWQVGDETEIQGTILSGLTGDPLEQSGVEITADPGGGFSTLTTETDANGEFTLTVFADRTHDVSVEAVADPAGPDEATFTITNTTRIDAPEDRPTLDLILGPEYDGDGTATAPYQIDDVEGLQQMRYDLGAHYELADDIDASETDRWFGGSGFEPIGACDGDYEDPWDPCDDDEGRTDWDPFTGTLDGNGNLIADLVINRPETNESALFESAHDAVLSNIRFSAIDIEGHRNTAGLVGYFEGSDVSDTSAGVIENVSVAGDINGDLKTAGIVSTPSQVYMDNKNVFVGNVTGSDHVGGIAGRTPGNTIISTSYVQGNITAHGEGTVYVGEDRGYDSEPEVSAGGLVGNTGTESTFKNSYTAVTVTAPDNAGAIVGSDNGIDTFENVYWDETIGPDTAAGTYDVTGDIPLTTSEMTGVHADKRMEGLDFENTWRTVPGDYPVFQWEAEAADEVEITGHVTDALDDQSLAGVVVESSNDTATTDTDGRYTLNVSIEFAEEVTATAVGVDEGFTIRDSAIVDSPEEGDEVHLALGPTYDGVGSADDPYLVEDLEGLQQMRYDLGAHYQLADALDASETDRWFGGSGFEPIGETDTPFTGTFDGGESIIEQLTIDRPGEANVSLFGVTRSARIENVSLEGVDITGTVAVGGLVGSAGIGDEQTSVGRSSVTGSVTGTESVGGLAGWSSGEVVDSFATVTVTGDAAVGGLVGTNTEDATVGNAYAAGTVEGTTTETGGLVGHNTGTVAASYWDVTATGQDSSAGSAEGSGLTTRQMTGLNATETMAFDFPMTWHVTDSYPTLEWMETDPFFEATISETSSPVTAGEPLTVTATVTNWGDDGTQTVTLTDTTDGEQDSAEVGLDSGESAERLTFEWLTNRDDTGVGTVAVASANDTDTATVTVEAASNLSSLDIAGQGGEATLVEGDNAGITVTVENAGIRETQFDLTLEIGNEVETVESTAALAPEESQTIRFESVTGDLTPDEYDVTVSTADDTIAGTLTVGVPAESALSNLAVAGDGADGTISSGDDEPISVDVENVGGSASSFAVTLEVGDNVTETQQSADLDAGTSETIGFESVTNDLSPGSYDVTVSTADDTVSGKLTVEAPAEAELSNLDIAGQDVEATVLEGETGDVTLAVTNVGDRDGQFDVTLEISEEWSETQSIDSLTAGTSETVVFESVTDDLAPGAYTVTVSTVDDTVSGKLTVEAPAEPVLSNLDIAGQGGDATITAGEDESISVDVENVGDQHGQFTARLDIDGELAETNVTLDASANETVVFENVTGTLAPGEYTVTVSAGGNTETGSLSVDSEDEQDDDTSEDDGSEVTPPEDVNPVFPPGDDAEDREDTDGDSEGDADESDDEGETGEADDGDTDEGETDDGDTDEGETDDGDTDEGEADDSETGETGDGTDESGAGDDGSADETETDDESEELQADDETIGVEEADDDSAIPAALGGTPALVTLVFLLLVIAALAAFYKYQTDQTD